MPRYETREPVNEPELLSMEHHPEGFGFPGGLGEKRHCGIGGCAELAVYEGGYSDQSWIYLCETHGPEEAEYHGLAEVEDD